MERPTSVTVFGILNIVFAAFGFFGLLASVAMLALMGANSNNPVIQLIHDSPGLVAWMKLSIVLGLAAKAALLVAGVGLLKLKPWARILSIIYGIYAIVMVLLGTVVNYIFLMRPMLEQAHEKQGPEAAALIGGAVGGVLGGCFGIIYPVLLLIFMMRANVMAAFRPPAPATGQSTAASQP